MSNDLVKRLRICAAFDPDQAEAANRIEQLEADQEDWNRICNRYAARIQHFEAALTHIYAWYPISTFNPHQTIKEIKGFARKALEGKDV
jgi:hypothetical protein